MISLNKALRALRQCCARGVLIPPRLHLFAWTADRAGVGLGFRQEEAIRIGS